MIGATLDAIKARMAGQADAVAVRTPSHDLSYGALGETAARIAAALDRVDVGEQLPVAQLAPRSPAGIAAAVGLALAGRVYAPLDASLPEPTLQAQLAALRPRALLARHGQADLVARLLGGAPRAVGIDADLVLYEAAASSRPLPGAAYVIFTSGSSGEPKGVVIGHDNLDAFTTAAAEHYDLSAVDRLFNPAPLHFDFSILDVFGVLRAGGCVLCGPGDLRLPGDILEALRRLSPTVLAGVPSFFSYLSGGRAPSSSWFPDLRRVVFGGETFPIAALRRWMLAYPDVQFINTYGPTETTVFVSSLRLARPPETPPPIGAPFAGVRFELVDAMGQRVSGDDAGELWIGGHTFLAQGYLDPAATARAFLVNPLGDGVRYYRTGDLARRTPEGIVVVGRADSQVKIAGRRIELGAVEQALCALDGVADAVATTLRGADGAPVGIACHVASARGPEELRAELSAVLPAYMLPREIIVVSVIPRGRSGKLDRRALADREVAHAG